MCSASTSLGGRVCGVAVSGPRRGPNVSASRTTTQPVGVCHVVSSTFVPGMYTRDVGTSIPSGDTRNDPAPRSRRLPKTLGESNAGTHSQSTDPSGATSAPVWQLERKAYSAIGGNGERDAMGVNLRQSTDPGRDDTWLVSPWGKSKEHDRPHSVLQRGPGRLGRGSRRQWPLGACAVRHAAPRRGRQPSLHLRRASMPRDLPRMCGRRPRARSPIARSGGSPGERSSSAVARTTVQRQVLQGLIALVEQRDRLLQPLPLMVTIGGWGSASFVSTAGPRPWWNCPG